MTARSASPEEELLPCPFCGETPQAPVNYKEAMCGNIACGINGIWMPTAAWNRRAFLIADQDNAGVTNAAAQDATTSEKVSQSVNTTVTGLSQISVDDAGPSPAAAAPIHTDHPSRHWDRTCPACIADGAPAPLAQAVADISYEAFARNVAASNHGLGRIAVDNRGIFVFCTNPCPHQDACLRESKCLLAPSAPPPPAPKDILKTLPFAFGCYKESHGQPRCDVWCKAGCCVTSTDAERKCGSNGGGDSCAYCGRDLSTQGLCEDGRGGSVQSQRESEERLLASVIAVEALSPPPPAPVARVEEPQWLPQLRKRVADGNDVGYEEILLEHIAHLRSLLAQGAGEKEKS